MRRRLVVVQPYVPAYRVPFFARLAADLDACGIDLTVAHGVPAGPVAARGDRAELPGAVVLAQRVLPVGGGRQLVWRRLGDLAGQADALVLEQALRNLETYPLLVGKRRQPIGLWGHGQTHTHRPSPLVRAAKAAVTRRADRFFAYTEAGARYALGAGLPPDRVTVVRNATDTTALSAARRRVSPDRADALRAEHGLTPGRTGLYVGGLDASKRIPFLLAAAARTARALPGFRLLVAGDGTERPRVAEAARTTEWARYLGTATGERKALLGAVADVLMVPGRVGLISVDSFALGVPVITTRWPFHAPEFEYLRDGHNALVVPGGVTEYADALTRLLTDPQRLGALRTACRAEAVRYSVESMSARFADGVRRLLNSPPADVTGTRTAGRTTPPSC